MCQNPASFVWCNPADALLVISMGELHWEHPQLFALLVLQESYDYPALRVFRASLTGCTWQLPVCINSLGWSMKLSRSLGFQGPTQQHSLPSGMRRVAMEAWRKGLKPWAQGGWIHLNAAGASPAAQEVRWGWRGGGIRLPETSERPEDKRP